jgi:HK97 family phage major capsid protein
MATARELRDNRASVLDKARLMVEAAEAENRDLSQQEQVQYNDMLSEAGSMEARISRLEAMPQTPQLGRRGAPAHLKGGLGDNEARAFEAYLKNGDVGGLRHMQSESERGERGPVVEIELPLTEARSRVRQGEYRAVDSTMNITTAADGGATVPTGLAPRIAARMVEIRLTERLGCQMIPGVGTTVNHTYENADPVIFATKGEQADDLSTNDYERDAMVLANKAFTLVKKTKKLNLTEELLDDTGENLLEAIGSWIGRGIGLTHNYMLLTEAAATGTAAKTFASATAIAAGEPEDLVFHDTLSYYLDDASNPAFVTRPSTLGLVKGLTGNVRQYGEQTLASGPMRQLLGYPVQYSNYAAAVAASAKSLYFGNWYYMGYREAPALRLIRDPYSEDGVVVLKYSFRTVYGLLIAGAVGYGVHPSA